LYSQSVSNQRIESWWSFLRKSESDWLSRFFKNLSDSGHFDNSNQVHLGCVKFCFTALIQEELSRIARHWNLHKIRPCANTNSLPGRPDVLYFLPQLHNTSDCKATVISDELSTADEVCYYVIPETGCSQ
jgi:hypothetical protein